MLLVKGRRNLAISGHRMVSTQMVSITEPLAKLPIELLEQVFDAFGDIVFCVKDNDGIYQSVNHAFVERVGAKGKADLIGKHANDLFPKYLAQTFMVQDETVMATKHSLKDQLERITQPDGSMGWFLASKFPVVNEAGEVQGVIGVSQDLNWPRDSELELANLRKLVDYINDNLDQPLRTERLAGIIELSGDQLDRRMKRVFRLSTKKFIMKCRLEKATRQLESTDLQISKIALSCGFTDQSSFTRHFRSATSDTPASFRKKYRTEKS
ncbi:MAG: AraC family transcriptional regulator [Planctomycetota bacterium]